MSVCDSKGAQMDPDDWNATGMTLEDDEDQPVTVHYGEHLTSRTTVRQIASRLGLTPDEVRENLAELVALGALIPCGPDEYDAEGVEA